jgi:hypothetical protein
VLSFVKACISRSWLRVKIDCMSTSTAYKISNVWPLKCVYDRWKHVKSHHYLDIIKAATQDPLAQYCSRSAPWHIFPAVDSLKPFKYRISRVFDVCCEFISLRLRFGFEAIVSARCIIQLLLYTSFKTAWATTKFPQGILHHSVKVNVKLRSIDSEMGF